MVICCKSCGLLYRDEWSPHCNDRHKPIDDAALVRCESCGVEYGVGQSPYCKDGHGSVLRSLAPHFAPYFDIGLGEHVEAPDQRRKLMRQNHLDYRDKPRVGELSARRDKIEERRRMRASVDDVIQPPDSTDVDGPVTVLYDHRERPLRRQIGFRAVPDPNNIIDPHPFLTMLRRTP